MVTSKPELLNSLKTRTRLNHEGEAAPISVQILGTEAQQMAQAAQFNVHNGADIIDINMGCPAKKVCHVSAGSALLKNEPLVRDILSSVVRAVSVPVTLKIRTGWDKDNKNALSIARIAEQSGIQALTIHGRTRACAYHGEAEYDTIKTVKQQVSIPIIANGDINSAEKAQDVLQYTGADAIMIGRAAYHDPWMLTAADRLLYGDDHPLPTRKEVLEQYIDYMAARIDEGVPLRMMTRHLIGFYQGAPGAKRWRRCLAEEVGRHGDLDMLCQAAAQMELQAA